MQNIKIITIILSVFLFINTSSATVLPEGVSPNSIMVKQDNPSFTVKLKSNPSTGYSWFLARYDRNLITSAKHRYVPPTSQLVGASGFELWTFTVNPQAFSSKTITRLKFYYIRPWEGVTKQTPPKIISVVII